MMKNESREDPWLVGFFGNSTHPFVVNEKPLSVVFRGE
jgi:hypothetical protein